MKKSIYNIVLKLFLITSLSFSIYSCDNDYNYYNSNRVVYDPDSETPLISFLTDKDNSVNQQFNNEIRKTVNYTKIPYKQVDIKSINTTGQIPKTTKVLVIQEPKSLNKKAMEAILNFVASGNTIYFPNVSPHKNFRYLAGIKRNVQLTTNVEALGFYFRKNLIPDFKDRSYKNGDRHFGFDRDNYKDDIEVWATAANDTTYPTIVKNKIGNGQVLTMNTTLQASKHNRGLLFGSILAGLEQIPYPVASVSSIMLDDFPAPLYKVKKEPVYAEYKMNQSDFYVKKWWPDLLNLAKKFDIKYTTVACFDYRNNTSPPFLFSEWESLKPVVSPHNNSIPDLLMDDVIKNGHESGLHGYNHQSLIQEDWPNPDFMETSLISANKRWKSLNYGPLPISYVPPSNHVDSLGIAALEKGAPTIKYMASLYLGHFETGGNREYDDEPYSYHMFDFPRISSGYVLDEESQFDQQSLYLYTGIWSHFVHPDDVYQIPDVTNKDSKGAFKYRNSENYGWEKSADGSPGMLPRFEDYLTKTKDMFPFMRFLTTKDAASITKSWRYATYTYSFNKNELTINSNNKDDNAFWFIYVTSKNTQTVENNLKEKNIKFNKTPLLDGFLYNINTKDSSYKTQLFNVKTNQDINFKYVLEDYNFYFSSKKSFDSLEDEISYLVSENQLDKAIYLLKQKIKLSNTFSEKDWLNLNKYSKWNEQAYSFWSFLDTSYLESESINYVDLCRLITKGDEFPDEETKKKWLKRQLKFYPNDAVLNHEYNKHFIIKDDINISTDNIIRYMETSRNAEENTKLFELLLSRDKAKAEEFLKRKTPCKDDFLIAKANEITWFYADQKKYKSALEWSKCATDVSEESLSYWRKTIGEYQFLKESNYPEYIEYILANHPEKVAPELINIESCFKSELISFSADIAYAFGNIGAFRKALNWAECSEDIPLKDKLYWYLGLRNYSMFELMYSRFKEENPEDNSFDAEIVEFYLSTNRHNEAFSLFEGLTPSLKKNELQKRLNENAMFLSNEKLSYLLRKNPSVFYPDIREKLEKRIRLNAGNTIELKSDIFSDQLNPNYLNNELLYSFFSKKKNTHSIGITQSRAYAVPIDSINDNNLDLNLIGMSYQFKSKDRLGKLRYNYGARFEFDEDSNPFYHLNTGVSLAKEQAYGSLTLSYQPAITGPAYQLNIYRTQLVAYQEFTFKKRYETVFNFEGNHYSDNGMDGLLSSRLGLLYTIKKRAILSPYLEMSGMLGNRDFTNGFPYWTIKEQFFGGAGLRYAYNNPENKISVNLNAAFFKDTFSGSFFRYSGQVNYPIFDYFYFSANAEFFTLENFYSNNFNFGLKYYFKKK